MTAGAAISSKRCYSDRKTLQVMRRVARNSKLDSNHPNARQKANLEKMLDEYVHNR